MIWSDLILAKCLDQTAEHLQLDSKMHSDLEGGNHADLSAIQI